MKILKLKHFILIGTAVLQVIIFIVFLARLFGGSTVRSYLEKGNYENAVKLINKYDKLAADEEIAGEIKSIISSAESDFLNGNMAFGKAEATINKFSGIESENYKKFISDASTCINSVNSGDNAMNEQKYEQALDYYGNLPDDNAETKKLKDEKIRSVYNVMSDKLVEMAKEGRYHDIMSAVEKLKEEASDETLISKIDEWEKTYLSEWLEQQRGERIFTGEDGAIRLAAEYDSLVSGSDILSEVDSDFQAYLMTGIGNQKYSTVLELLDPAFDDIKKYFGEQGANTYNELRITCATAMLNQARTEGEFRGENGAISLADKLNSYREGSADKAALINEFTAAERASLIGKINATRTASGLSELASDADLEKAAVTMMSKLNNDSYEDKDLFDALSDNNVKYEKACCAWNDYAADADEVFSKFTPIEDFGILTVPDLKKIGVGMTFDEQSQYFSWFIIEIVTPEGK